MKKVIILMLGFVTLFTACKPDSAEPVVIAPKVRVKLEHVFNGVAVDTTSKFITENGDTVQFSELKYFLSNFSLVQLDGTEAVDNYGYHLVDISKSNVQDIEIKDLKAGAYVSFKFGIGVDSLHNHTVESAKGDLDPAGGDQMIWSWATGYKFVKLEGKYNSKAKTTGDFVFHAGGDANYKKFVFGGSASAARLSSETTSVQLLDIKVESGKTTEIHLVVDLAELFVSPETIDLATTNKGHTTGPLIMNNLATSTVSGMNGWFELHHVTTK